MAALTEIYVDPAIAANSGSGSIGDPYGDLQYALNTATRDSTNGNRINIKAGTSEVLTGSLSFATFGSPGTNAPLVFQGYSASAGDGGQGVVSGGGGAFSIMSMPLYTYMADLRCTNVGAAILLDFSGHNHLTNCELDTVTGTGGNGLGTTAGSCSFTGCYLHDFGSGITGILGGANVIGCYFAGAFLRAIDFATNGSGTALRNIFNLTGATIGIYSRERSHAIRGNSILCVSGTGLGIELTSSSDHGECENNLIEGFSGTGGVGIKIASGGHFAFYRNNSFYNNTTNESGVSGGGALINFGGNESLGSTPFAKSGSNTFSNRATYYEPQNVGSVIAGAFPTVIRLDRGAVQHADAGGGSGGGIRLVGMGGLVS